MKSQGNNVSLCCDQVSTFLLLFTMSYGADCSHRVHLNKKRELCYIMSPVIKLGPLQLKQHC